jgi:hypothetical protein
VPLNFSLTEPILLNPSESVADGKPLHWWCSREGAIPQDLNAIMRKN